jgi:hypothetical protein
MSNLVPFEAQLPAHITALGDQMISADDLIASGGGFPVVSIKGKVFHIARGDSKEMVMREDGTPAASIEVVILRANPKLSKTYYSQGYEEGSIDKPTCYSNDGVEPGADAQEKQSTKCQTCVHNQWGSKITEQGSKAKACADVKRLAIAPIGQLNDPMLLRVPAASLKSLTEYGDKLKKRGVKYPAVSTKISFDFSVAYPALTFTPVSFITEAMARQVQEVMNSDVVNQIIGGVRIDTPPQLAAPQVPEAATPGTATKPSPGPVASASPAVAAPVSKSQVKRVAAQKAEPAAAPKPAEQKSKVVEVNAGDLEADLAKVLSEAGFDD